MNHEPGAFSGTTSMASIFSLYSKENIFIRNLTFKKKYRDYTGAEHGDR